MTHQISELLNEGASYLKTHGLEDAQDSSIALLSYVLNQSQTDIFLKPNESVEEYQKTEFFNLIEKRSARLPLQYLLGSTGFRYAELRARPGVFIPRPETEVLVQVVIDHLREIKSPKILDVGTGTGAIAISFAMEIKNAAVVATDKSPEAIQLAKQNALANGVSERIQFIQTDYWNGIQEKFDVIVSNPPYLSEEEMRSLQPEIEYEPKTALDGGSDGLKAYIYMIRQAFLILKEGGFVAVEIGASQAKSVSSLFAEAGFTQIKVAKDLAGLDRVVSASYGKNCN